MFLLGQTKDAVVFPNLHVPPPKVADLADVPKSCDVMLKVTMGDSNTTLIEAVERFQPDISILLVRYPASVAQHLQPATRGSGVSGQTRPGELLPRETVLRQLEWTWAMSAFQWDAIILFEELLFNPSVARQKLKNAGFSDVSLDSMDRMRRTKKDVERFNGKASRWSRAVRNPSKYVREARTSAPGWDFGGASKSPAIQLSRLREDFPKQKASPELRRISAQLCPTLNEYYLLHHPELDSVAGRVNDPSSGGTNLGNKPDAWLAAVQRFHRLVDDRAAAMTDNDLAKPEGTRIRVHLRERWVVLALASSTWVRNGVAFNWMAALNRLHVDNFVLVSLDLPTHEALVAVGAPSFFFETHYIGAVTGVGASSQNRASQSSLLTYKWKLVVAVLKRGVSTLLADLDTVFLRDFRSLLDQSQSHIIAARGTSKGQIIRTPLIFLRSCIEVLHLMPRLVGAIAHFKDDEAALNKACTAAEKFVACLWKFLKSYFSCTLIFFNRFCPELLRGPNRRSSFRPLTGLLRARLFGASPIQRTPPPLLLLMHRRPRWHLEAGPF
jgi:hypothetical protein